MNNLQEIISKYDLNIRKYEEKNHIKIIDTDKGKFVLKNNSEKEHELYEYLTNKQFDYLIDKEDLENYSIYPYIHEVDIPIEEKAIDLVNILALLHNKTTFYRQVVLDDIKKMYEDLNQKINNLYRYYYDLQDIIEQKVYMSPEQYLLIRNISLVYSSLNFAKDKLNKWYELKLKQKKERVVLLHNKPSLDHILINNRKQLISWNDCKRDIPIYDFLYFYKKNYLMLDMTSLFELYQSKFYYTEDEYLLFLTLLTIPDKIIFSKNHYSDCQKVYEIIKYLMKTKDFVLKEDEKYQETYKDEF